MSKIVMFGNQKGGVGKTTLTALCANALSSPPFNKSVLVIDADKQQSIIKRRLSDVQSSDQETPYKVEFMTVADFVKNIRDVASNYEFILIDAAGKLDNNLHVDQQEIINFLVYVDYLFIPFVPGNYSLESTLDYLKIVLKLRVKRKDMSRPLEVIGFVNMYERRTLDDKFLMEELEELQGMINIDFMESKLSRYALFRNTDTLTSFYDDSETRDKAIRNFSKWFNEFLKKVG